MLYTEDTRIAALAVHIVGNKAKDEPLLVAPALSGQVGDTGLMQTLTAYFAGGFKSEEYYNLHHETDLACNEVYNFVCKVFDDRETFYDNSVGLARHLYETGTHPQIKGGEFYVVYFTGCRFGGEAVDAVGLFKSETRDTFLEVGEQDGQLHISSCQGINVDKLDKGCLVFNTEREEGFAVCVVDNTNRAEARYWIDDFLHVRPRQDNYHNTHNVLVIEDEFAISDSAVRKQARAYKSVIKLDRNFHIYVHGNRNLLEQGEDEKGKFYKVYYEEEE